MNTTETLLERALFLIMDEWGKTREEALAWLNDDEADWTPRPQSDCPAEIDGKPAFIQVTRTTTVGRPTDGLALGLVSPMTPAAIDEMARKELDATELDRCLGEPAAAQRLLKPDAKTS